MGKSKSTTTTTPTNPSWVTSNVQGLTGQIQGLSGTDPLSYVADWNPYQQQAGGLAERLGGSNPYIDKAFNTLDLVGNYKAPQATASSLLDNLSSYMSPYTNQVVDTSLAGYDKDAGRQVAQNLADQARASAFNSSRGAIQGAELTGNLALNRGQLESGLRDQGFQVGAGLSNQDAERKTSTSLANAQLNLAKQNQGLQIAQMLADMGLATDASSRADIATLLGVGSDKYNVDTAQAQAPLSLLNAQTSMTGSLPYGLFNGQTQKTTSSPSALSTLGTLAMAAAAPFTGGTSLLGLGGSLGGALASGVGSLGGLTGAMRGLTGLGVGEISPMSLISAY